MKPNKPWHIQASTSRAYGETGFDTNKHGKDGLIFAFFVF